jgi:dihydrofolate synthase/folylpolyglutamate synthase
VPGMLRVLLPLFDRILVTQFQENPRAVPPQQLAAWCRAELAAAGIAERVELVVCAQPAEAWQAALAGAGRDDLICIAGSVFIAAELRALVAADATAAAAGV